MFQVKDKDKDNISKIKYVEVNRRLLLPNTTLLLFRKLIRTQSAAKVSDIRVVSLEKRCPVIYAEQYGL